MINLIKNNLNIIKYILFSVVVISIIVMYYNIKIQSEVITNLKKDNAELVLKVDSQTRQIQDIKDSVEANISLIKNNEKKQQEIDLKVNKINSKLDSHDINKIMEKKPTLLIKKINQASKIRKDKLMELTK